MEHKKKTLLMVQFFMPSLACTTASTQVGFQPILAEVVTKLHHMQGYEKLSQGMDGASFDLIHFHSLTCAFRKMCGRVELKKAVFFTA